MYLRCIGYISQIGALSDLALEASANALPPPSEQEVATARALVDTVIAARDVFGEGFWWCRWWCVVVPGRL